jgi:uncharacterized protein (TIGR03089 family)
MSNPIWQALEGRVRRRPADPVVTYIDADGQRSELSAKTLANNAAKAANALRDEAFVEAGSRLAFHVPWHWQRSVWTLAAWLTGATVVPGGSPDQCDLVIAGPGEVSGLLGGQFGPAGAGELWVVSVHPFGLPNPSLPEGCLDAATITRIQPDAFAPEPFSVDAFSVDDDAIAALALVGGASFGQQDLLQRASAIGGSHLLKAGERFAVVGAPVDVLDAWLLGSLVPIACDASIVMAAQGLDGAEISRRESARLIE